LASRWPPAVRALTSRWSACGPPKHDRLLPAQDVARAALLRRGRDVVERPAALGLGLGEGDDALARGDGVQVFVLLRGAAGVLERAGADDDGRHVGLDHQRLAELLHHHADVDGAAERPSTIFAMMLRWISLDPP
jgi:hypothetical protein